MTKEECRVIVASSVLEWDHQLESIATTEERDGFLWILDRMEKLYHEGRYDDCAFTYTRSLKSLKEKILDNYKHKTQIVMELQ